MTDAEETLHVRHTPKLYLSALKSMVYFKILPTYDRHIKIVLPLNNLNMEMQRTRYKTKRIFNLDFKPWEINNFSNVINII